MYNPVGITCENPKKSKCHVKIRLIYLSKNKSHKMPCTTPSKLPVKKQKSQNAMYNPVGITCENLKNSKCHVKIRLIYLSKTKVTKCHVQFRLIYLSKNKSRKMPCTIPSELPVKKRKSQNAMYNPVGNTCQKTKVTKCHVQPRRNYLSKNESHKMPCTTPPKLPVKNGKSQNAMSLTMSGGMFHTDGKRLNGGHDNSQNPSKPCVADLMCGIIGACECR